MNEQQIQLWRECADKLRQASSLLDDVDLTLCLELDAPSNAVDRLRTAIDTLSGLPYLFTPQTQWTGGDSSDPSNFKTVPPHIVR